MDYYKAFRKINKTKERRKRQKELEELLSEIKKRFIEASTDETN